MAPGQALLPGVGGDEGAGEEAGGAEGAAAQGGQVAVEHAGGLRFDRSDARFAGVSKGSSGNSVSTAVVGGLIIGVVERVAAGYLDPIVGGGTKDFAPYVVMIIALMFKPYGLFGKHKIERI